MISRDIVYGEIYGQLKETLFSFHYSFLLFYISSGVVQILHSIDVNWSYVYNTQESDLCSSILHLILKGYIHCIQIMVWIREHMFNLLILKFYIPMLSSFILRILIFCFSKQTTKLPAFLKLTIQNIEDLKEAKYCYLHLKQILNYKP